MVNEKRENAEKKKLPRIRTCYQLVGRALLAIHLHLNTLIIKDQIKIAHLCLGHDGTRIGQMKLKLAPVVATIRSIHSQTSLDFTVVEKHECEVGFRQVNQIRLGAKLDVREPLNQTGVEENKPVWFSGRSFEQERLNQLEKGVKVILGQERVADHELSVQCVPIKWLPSRKQISA